MKQPKTCKNHNKKQLQKRCTVAQNRKGALFFGRQKQTDQET
jgi:hypothetical protein